MTTKTAERPRFPMFIYKLEHYQQALLAHDWNYHEHLRQAGKHPDRERLLICRFEAGQQQRIALLHATKFFDKECKLFNAAELEATKLPSIYNDNP